MRIRKGYVLNEIADQKIVVAVGEETLRFSGVIKLNTTGAFLWNRLENPCTMEDLVQAVADNYKVTREQASQDVKAFLEVLQSAGIIEE